MGHYEYYDDQCNCPGIPSSGAGDNESAYSYMEGFCVCPQGSVYLTMKDLEGNETTNYPVTVYDVNETEIGYVENKTEYISVWNNAASNQAVGVLSGAGGPFGFFLKLNRGQTAPEYVIGVPDAVDAGIYESIYEAQYE